MKTAAINPCPAVAEDAETIQTPSARSTLEDFRKKNSAVSAFSALSSRSAASGVSARQWRARGDDFNAERAEHARESPNENFATSAPSAFKPSPRPSVCPRGRGERAETISNAERAEHARESPNENFATSAPSAFKRSPRPRVCPRGRGERAETISTPSAR